MHNQLDPPSEVTTKRMAWLYAAYWLFPLGMLIWCVAIGVPMYLPIVLAGAVGAGIRQHVKAVQKLRARTPNG